MKIFFVLHGFPPELSGGTERTVEALGRELSALGHDVTVVCGSLEVASTERVDTLEHAGLRVLRLHRDDLYFESWWKPHHPGVSATLQKLFERARPDVVHVHHWLRLTSDIARLARGAGARTVVTLHDYTAVLGRIVRRCDEDQAERAAGSAWMTAREADEEFDVLRRDLHAELRAADLLIAPSEAHAAGLREVAVAELPPIVVAPPPLLELPGRLAAPPVPGGTRLVTWGSVYPDKGLETVLDAMRAAGGDWSLQILGEAHDPEYRQEIQNFAAGLPVTFSGPFATADLERIEADYAVLPSLCRESYGLVVDEAQALGLPVLAADVPAYRERLQPESTAYFPPGDAASLTMMLLDPSPFAGLPRPTPPALVDSATAAAGLLQRYEALQPAPFERDLAVDRARELAAFRRAERRLWAVLNAGAPRLPPDDFLA